MKRTKEKLDLELKQATIEKRKAETELIRSKLPVTPNPEFQQFTFDYVQELRKENEILKAESVELKDLRTQHKELQHSFDMARVEIHNLEQTIENKAKLNTQLLSDSFTKTAENYNLKLQVNKLKVQQMSILIVSCCFVIWTIAALIRSFI